MPIVIDYALVRNTIEHLPVAVAIFDRELQLVACSRQFLIECDVKEDPSGRQLHEIFPGATERWPKLLERSLAGEVLASKYDPFVWPGGTVSWLEWTTRPWQPTNDGIAGVLVHVKVISDDAQAEANRKHLEEKLRNEYARFRNMERQQRTILELSNEVILICSYSGQIFDCSAALHRLLGVNALEVLPNLLLERVHPLDRQIFVETLRHSIESNQSEAAVLIRCLTIEGSYCWLDWRFSILHDYQLILGVARDITHEITRQEEQSRMLAALKTSQERLTQAERIATVGYWESNVDGSDSHFSEGLYTIYGLSIENPLTSLQDLWKYTADNRYRTCITHIQRAITNCEPFEFDYAIRRQDGEQRNLYARGEPVFDEDGHMIKLQGIVQDITEQVRAAKALHEREQQLAEAQHIARIGSWHWEIASGVVTWSREMYNLLGYAEGEIVPTYEAFMARVPAVEKHTVTANIEAVLRNKEPAQYRHRVELPSGEIRTFHVRHHPYVNEEGVVTVLEGTSQDITEILEVERRLAQQAKDLARSNQDLAQFAYVASHDLREPLRKVKSFTELLARHYGDQLDDRGRQWMQHIVTDTARMQSLIQDVLAYSQLRQDRQLQDVTDLNRVFEQACTALYSRIQATSAQVTADPLPTVLANFTQMSQLFQNLLDNALKFHGAGAPVIYVAAHQDDDFWRIEVTDNGIGIDRRHRERIFEMFQRVHGRTQHAGSGMGLAICKKIVEGHGGQIGVESGLGAGSTFWFTLPLSKQDERREQNVNGVAE